MPRSTQRPSSHRSRIISHGSTTSAGTSLISWRIGSSSCSTKRRSPAAPPGSACSTKPSRRFASMSAAKSLPLEPTLNLMQDARPEKRRAAAEALGRTLKAHERTFALITNTLSKDREIADRWRGFKDIADARHLSNRVEGEVVDALVSAVRDAYPRLSHRYYALKARLFGAEVHRLLGSQRAASQLGLAGGAMDRGETGRARRLPRLLAPHGFDRAGLLRQGLDRRRHASREGARRLLASRRSRRLTPTCCSTIRAGRATS